MKLGHSEMVGGVSRFDTLTPQITVLAGGQTDGSSLGIAAQGGDTYLLQRFALQVYGKYDAASSMRFALEHQNPLLAGAIVGGHDLPEKVFSLLSTSDPNLFLWALKPSEEGMAKGITARLWNLSAKSTEFSLKMNGGIAKAWTTTHLETETGSATVTGYALRAQAARWQILTFRLLPALHQSAEKSR